MASSIMHLSRGVKETWDAMGKRQKTVIIAGISCVFLAFLVILLFVKNGTHYEALWSNLDPLDAQGIVQELERQSIPYELTQGGKTVMVPEDQVYRLRLSLASQGLPASGIVGLESIGQGGIWATDFERRVQYIRAISGELTRTVKEIAGIQEARVHVVLSEPSVFQSQSKPATAAVMLKPLPGHEIPPSTVKGIVNLVSCSVEGLSPQDVAVIDSKGRLLSQNQGSLDDLGLLSGNGYELAAAVEKDLEGRLTQLLSTVLGAGNVVCQVRAELALDQIRIQDIKYQNEQEPTVRSREERSEDFRGTGTGPGGPAGGLDVPTYGTGSSGESEYSLQETLTNYEVGETTTETLVSPGQITRLSVAVVVNKDLDDMEKERVQETVTAALGLDPTRHDTINVTGIPFDTTLSQKVDAALTPDPGEQPFKRIYIYVVAVALALILGTIIIFLMRKQNGHTAEVPTPHLPFPEEEETVIPDESARSAQQSVEKMARSNPATVAALLKSWILEDDR